MKFTESHEWIEQKGEAALVGISDFAQKELGEIVFVELPEVGKSVKAGEEIAVLESTKAASDVYSPVSGIVVEVNETLKQTPELVNASPEKEGWIFKLEPFDAKELEALLDEQSYRSRHE